MGDDLALVYLQLVTCVCVISNTPGGHLTLINIENIRGQISTNFIYYNKVRPIKIYGASLRMYMT